MKQVTNHILERGKIESARVDLLEVIVHNHAVDSSNKIKGHAALNRPWNKRWKKIKEDL